MRLSHEKITSALIPPGVPGERDWQDSGSYARHHLAAHAAACGVLDSLVCDPGFLFTASPGTVLAERRRLHTAEGKRAFAAFEMSLSGWESQPDTERIQRLAAKAARVRAVPLVIACAKLTPGDWPIRWAAWSGQGHRILTGHGDTVRAMAIARAGDRDVIVSGSEDRIVLVREYCP